MTGARRAERRRRAHPGVDVQPRLGSAAVVRLPFQQGTLRRHAGSSVGGGARHLGSNPRCGSGARTEGRDQMALSFEDFCKRLESLRVDRSGGLPKPYKPILVAAVVILIHKGKQIDRNVLLDGALRSAFQQLLALLFPEWPLKANPEYPFRHLENDGIWKLVPIEGASAELRAAKASHAEAWDVLRHVRCAQLDEESLRAPRCRSELRARGSSGSSARTTSRRTLRQADALQDLRGTKCPEPAVPVARREQLHGDGPSRSTSRHHWDETPFARAGWSCRRRETHGLSGTGRYSHR